MSKNTLDLTLPNNLDTQLALLMGMFEDGTSEWREELEELELPQEALTWQPHENFHSIGGVILHIADVEAHWIHKVAAQRERSDEELKRLLAEETQQYHQQWPSPPNEPLAWYWAQCDEVRQRTLELVCEMADPLTIGTRIERDTDYTLRWMLHHVLTHEAYHGGQAVMLGMMYMKR